MRIDVEFVGKAEPLAEQYEGVGAISFAVEDRAPPHLRGLLVPAVGDLVRLRMHPGPDVREFRCTERLWDFGEVAEPALRLRVDMP